MNEIETVRRIYAGPGGATFALEFGGADGRGQSKLQDSQACSVKAKQTMQNKKTNTSTKKPQQQQQQYTHNQGVGYLKKPVRLTNP